MPAALDSSMTLVALLVWPTIGAARRLFDVRAALFLYLLGLVVILQGGSTTALIAYLAAAFVFFSAYALPRATIIAGAAALTGILLFAPLIFDPGLTSRLSPALAVAPAKGGSFWHRQQIWGFVIDKIGERPLLGWGMGNSRMVPGAHDEFWPGAEHIPLHPHNAALQLRLELGLPGVLLGAGGLAALIWSVYRLLPDRLDRACAAAALAVGAIHALISYSLWHEWWIAFLILTVLFLCGASSRRHRGAATWLEP
jgi:O-antigen ligase